MNDAWISTSRPARVTACCTSHGTSSRRSRSGGVRSARVEGARRVLFADAALAAEEERVAGRAGGRDVLERAAERGTDDDLAFVAEARAEKGADVAHEDDDRASRADDERRVGD